MHGLVTACTQDKSVNCPCSLHLYVTAIRHVKPIIVDIDGTVYVEYVVESLLEDRVSIV